MKSNREAEKLSHDIISIGSFQKGRKIELVRVSLGQLSGISPDKLKSDFRTFVKGTNAEDVELFTKYERPHIKCLCGYYGKADVKDAKTARCPKCRSADVFIESGKGTRIEKIHFSNFGSD